ncbi:MAG: NAD-dependent epimerase/dehydratase family protein [Anaerolineales bacterium]|nr:MAG: NAD-dependent epimerase/dehydratase family protein [Anaerolineales bacterium]
MVVEANLTTTTFWHERPVLVTGCTGLLGSWLTQTLIESGADVVGLVRDDVPQSWLVSSGNIRRIRVVHGTVTDYALVERVVNEYEIDTVFHLAAQTIVGIANRAPLSTFESNIRGTWVLLEVIRRSPTVKRVVMASSDKAYGSQPILPYTEEMPLQGQHPYDVSKSAADLIAQMYGKTYGLPIAITRCANLYGGGDLNWNRLIPGTIRSALQGQRPLIRSDGTYVRDYLYVRDAVNAYLMVAQALDQKGIQGQAFNCGTDAPMRVLDMVQLILSLSPHPELTPLVLDEVSNEIKDQYLDSAKIGKLIGWKPTYSRETALSETIAWYARHLDLAS